MKKHIVLILGLFIAGFAMAAVPKDFKKEIVKVDVEHAIHMDAVSSDVKIDVLFNGNEMNMYWCDDIEGSKPISISNDIYKTDLDAFPPVPLEDGKPMKGFRKLNVPPNRQK
jgi:hypothetical protein